MYCYLHFNLSERYAEGPEAEAFYAKFDALLEESRRLMINPDPTWGFETPAKYWLVEFDPGTGFPRREIVLKNFYEHIVKIKYPRGDRRSYSERSRWLDIRSCPDNKWRQAGFAYDDFIRHFKCYHLKKREFYLV